MHLLIRAAESRHDCEPPGYAEKSFSTAAAPPRRLVVASHSNMIGGGRRGDKMEEEEEEKEEGFMLTGSRAPRRARIPLPVRWMDESMDGYTHTGDLRRRLGPLHGFDLRGRRVAHLTTRLSYRPGGLLLECGVKGKDRLTR